ncbi:MAG: glutamine-hydrolyzing GMP synthase, partial [Candidatus Omnitrophica bacterium]|nr:glutamine-hydrolyzing GMP synthase [Candidatus Omnitrophota bacterium]
MKPETILIIDYGSQYNLLIARRIRELGVYCEILPPDLGSKGLDGQNIRGVILSGGPASIYQKGAPGLSAGLLDLGVPVLGICYGMQILCHTLGGSVRRSERREYGDATLKTRGKSVFFRNVPSSSRSWMSHGDSVARLPKGFRVIAATSNTPNAACEDSRRKMYGVQFHPEVAHTEHGLEMLRNFVFGICGARGDWSLSSFIRETVRSVRSEVGKGKVICGVSGGVDSTVV